jgi:hypothetical protein
MTVRLQLNELAGTYYQHQNTLGGEGIETQQFSGAGTTLMQVPLTNEAAQSHENFLRAQEAY